MSCLGVRFSNLVITWCGMVANKQVCGSEGMVVGRAGTLLLYALAIILFLSFSFMVFSVNSACA